MSLHSSYINICIQNKANIMRENRTAIVWFDKKNSNENNSEKKNTLYKKN